MKLYEIKEAYQQILEMDLQQEEMEKYLQIAQGDLEEKFQNIGLVYKTLSAEAEAIKQEEKKLSQRRKALENKAENLKKWLYSEMAQMDISKISKPNIVLSIAKNPPKLVCDESLVPSEYKVSETVIAIDKSKIKNDLKQGFKIAGAILIQETSLMIK